MAISGGDLARVAIAGQSFSVASGSSGSIRLGGYKPTSRRMGDGSTIFTGELEDWSMSGMDLAIDASGGQLDFLQSTANALEAVPCEVELNDGTVYSGSGLVVDSYDYNTATTTVTLSMMGAGQLLKQASSKGGLLGFLGL